MCNNLCTRSGAVTQVKFNDTSTLPVTSNDSRQKKFIKGQTLSFKRTGNHRQTVGKFVLTMKKALVLIHTTDDSDTYRKGCPVAFSRAPSSFETMACVGSKIAVGCYGGEVLFLRAPLLSPS